MFNALTIKPIEFTSSQGQVIIESDTVIQIKDIGGMKIGYTSNGLAFDISPDEYVKLSGSCNNTTH